MKLAELMSSVTLTDAHLVHDEAEIETATMADDWRIVTLWMGSLWGTTAATTVWPASW